jgi:hypothetical protein
MFVHPEVHVELARERHRELLAKAESRRLAGARNRPTGVTTSQRTRDGGHARPPATAPGRCEGVLTTADHFGHRETGGIVVDLFWSRSDVRDDFRVVVEDEREGARFVLHPPTGREAIQAFYHPFSAAADGAVSPRLPAGLDPQTHERRSEA